MICPYCGNNVVSSRRNCDECGFDLEPSKKLVRRSNVFYNRGLRMAQVRNFTSAIPVLEKSLELNKHNSDARNLLGLIYYETGDIVNALSSWLISRHLDPEDNEADYFLEKVKRDTAELDSMNQAIKKYNLGLEEARQHNFDLAIIQLKRALQINKKLIKAYQLLALIYMEDGETVKAYRLINNGLKIDIGNTALLKYRQELIGNSDEEEDIVPDTDTGNEKKKSIEAKYSYKEEKPSILPFINLILGVIIGIICAQWLIVPTVKKNMKQEYDSNKIDYSAELAAKNATIAQLQKTVTNQEKEISTLENKLGGDVNTNVNVNSESYTNFFETLGIYKELIDREYTDDELVSLAYKLWEIDTDEIRQQHASDLLKSMRNEIYPLAAKKVYDQGKAYFDDEKYDDAILWLSAASAMNESFDNPLYYLGRSYQAEGRYAEAIASYEKVLEVVPNSTLKDMVNERIEECKSEPAD